MIRTFQMHKIRKTEELDGLWEFYTMDEDGRRLDSFSLPVPGCWESHPRLSSYRGRGVYTRTITLKEKRNLRLEFKGVSHSSQVYLDGKKIASHYNAYTIFDAVMPDVLAGAHRLEVVVDNRFTKESALHIPNDYYTYGGITRPVCLEEIPDIYIQEVSCIPKWQQGEWSLSCEILVRNLRKEPQSIQGILKMEEREISLEGVCNYGLTQWKTELSGLKAEAWSPKNPRLYPVELRLLKEGNPLDDYIDRIGFREVKVCGNRILLNGEELYIKGYNRHEDHPFSGCALSFQEMDLDLNLALLSNANLIRTSHYPNDERFLDLCDEKGILVWEESHARGLTEENMSHPNFQQQSLECIEAMVRKHINHPSVILWGLLNECCSNTEFGRSCYSEQIAKIRQFDASRPVTFASDKHFSDLCMDLPDIISVNIYPGWYGEKPAGVMMDEIHEWLTEKLGVEKPILISEFGAGAIYGYRSMLEEKWSEERQWEILKSSMEQLMEKSYINGMIIWQFCDCRVTEEEWALKRPKCQNNKGIFDQYRRPKLAYHMIREMFGKRRGQDGKN